MFKSFFRTKFYFVWKFLKINFGGKYKTNEKIESSNRNVYIFLAADYPNFGDIAITYAQKEFLKDVFQDANIIEIPCNETFNYLKYIKKHLKPKDIITIVGGGNVGNKYAYYEELRLSVIKYFKNNTIICFPQTIDFSNDVDGHKTMEKSMRIYKKSKKLLFLTRERKSYEIANRYLGEKAGLYPDIVLYLKNRLIIQKNETNKIGLCFRNDSEIEKSTAGVIKQIIADNNSMDSFDTVVGYDSFDYGTRYSALTKLLEYIASFNTVYTNRLHAMIFCYLTNTKCFFIDNSNKKISGVYAEWLTSVKTIKDYDENKKYIVKSEDSIEESFNLLKEKMRNI